MKAEHQERKDRMHPGELTTPNSRVPAYERFRLHLSSLGFRLYPGEFECVHSDHPLVDIAAKMGSHYWAFEYKSENDSISRGVEQVRSYSEWFDFVVLVCESMLDHRKSENYWKLWHLGAGIWVYDPKRDRRIVKAEPLLLAPEIERRRSVAKRFVSIKNRRRELQNEKYLDLSRFFQ